MWIETETKGSLDKKLEEMQAGHLSPIILELFMGAGRQNFPVTNRKQFQSYRAHPTPNDVVKNTPLGEKIHL